MGDVTPLQRSLEAAATGDVDMVPAFYDRFYERFPAERANFQNPCHSHGAMASEILSMLVALDEDSDEDAGWVPAMMRNLVFTHQSHGTIMLEHYRQALDLFVDVIAHVAGDDWTDEYDAAWRRSVERLYAIIEDAFPKEAAPSPDASALGRLVSAA